MKLVRKLHKWMGLLLAMQLLFWIGGGFIMSAIPLQMVHGKHLHSDKSPSPIESYQTLTELKPLLSQYEATGVRLYRLFNQPVYQLQSASGPHYLNAITGMPLPQLSDLNITELANRLYRGSGEIEQIYAAKATGEAAGLSGPIMRVDFDDWVNSSFYFNGYSGQLLRVRSDIWRLFDFVWMLHIMDYEHREDFNNPLLISFALFALLFTLSGVWLLLPWLKGARAKTRRRV